MFKNMNLAMLAKLGWKLAIGEKSLWIELILPKYLKKSSFFNTKSRKEFRLCGRGF